MRHILLIVLISSFLSSLSGCENREEKNEVTPPVTLVKVPGSDFNQVILSQEAANRVGIELVGLKEVQVQSNTNMPPTTAASATPPAPAIPPAALATAPTPSVAAGTQGAPSTQQPISPVSVTQPVAQQQIAPQAMLAKQIPYSAIIYGIHGETWIYTLIKPLTFMRAKVVVDHIDGDRAVLSEGPRANTAVVSVGASELYGAEYLGNIEP